MPNYNAGHSWPDRLGGLEFILRIGASSPASRLQLVRLFYIYPTMFGESGNNETKTRFTFYAPGFVREYGAKRKRRPTN